MFGQKRPQGVGGIVIWEIVGLSSLRCKTEQTITPPKLAKYKVMTKDKQNTIQLISAICLVVFGCALITAAFIVPPTAEIHPTVLTAFGEILTFAGAVIGVDYNYKYKSERDERKDD